MRYGSALLVLGTATLLAQAVVRPAMSDSARTAAAVTRVNPIDYQALHWRLIGPFRGGRVLAVTGIAGDSRHFYFGAVDGGVWASRDAGRTWRPIFDHQAVASIGAIAVAPSQPNTLYVGTGEADMRSDIAQGDGMYRSTDGGLTWSHIGLRDSRQIARIIVDPNDPQRVFVAALGHPYGPNAERGLFRTDDGGRHWRKVLYLNSNTGAVDVAFQPGNPNTLYAALWQTRRPPWSVYPPSNGPGSGLYVSHDGGNHWTQIVGHGFPAHPGRIGLAVAPTQPSRVYALVDGSWKSGGLYRSDDGGIDWRHVSADPRIFGRGWYFCSLTVDPSNADRVYVMNTIVLRSDDGGAHFIALKGDPTGDDFHQLWIDPADTERMILGSDQGAQVTLDGGKSWSTWYNQPTAQIYHVSTDERFPYWVYGAQQDSGAVALPSRTVQSDGITMRQFHEITPGGENGMIAPDPKHPWLIYGDGTQETATVQKLNLHTTQVRDIDPALAYLGTHHRTAWTLPLVFSPRDRSTLYFADQSLYSTVDGGLHWQRISPDLTRAHAGIPPNLDPVTAADNDHVGKRSGVIYAIAPSPISTKVIWVGTDDGLVWRTQDGGKHWVDVTPKVLGPWSKVAGIELSSFRRGTAYLAIDRHRLDDDTPYIYRTQDDGTTWTRIDSGIPREDFVNVVREDPVTPGLLYAGTEHGVFVSFDGGGRWQSLQQNLPVTSVRDLKVHGDDLVIATHGRGIWIMDDVTALRQMGLVHPGEVTLFKPAAAIRVRPVIFAGTPFPKDEPAAANPPNGAIIDYVLPARVRSPVTVSILDAQGNLVRRYSSAEHVAAPDPATLEFAPEWVTPPMIPAVTPGMQRLVWDLHYAKPMPPGAKNLRQPQQPGVWAPPGRYTVQLTVGGRIYRQPLIVSVDPRVKVSQAALLREFDLARKVEREQLKSTTAVAAAIKLLDALDTRMTSAGPARGALTALITRAQYVSGERSFPDRHQDFAARPPANVDSLASLAQDFDQLLQSVDGADADPSPDALVAYSSLSRRLQSTLEQWQRLEKEDVPRLNEQLHKQGGPPLSE